MPEQYQEAIEDFLLSDTKDALAAKKQASFITSPERLFSLASAQNWFDIDPRVNYLIELLQSLNKEKLLVICAHAETAIELEQALRVKEGIRAAICLLYTSPSPRDS